MRCLNRQSKWEHLRTSHLTRSLGEHLRIVSITIIFSRVSTCLRSAALAWSSRFEQKRPSIYIYNLFIYIYMYKYLFLLHCLEVLHSSHKQLSNPNSLHWSLGTKLQWFHWKTRILSAYNLDISVQWCQMTWTLQSALRERHDQLSIFLCVYLMCMYQWLRQMMTIPRKIHG